MLISLAATLAGVRADCTTDSDCSLNGECTAIPGNKKVCICDAPWSGAACEFLEFEPSLPGGAYGFSGGPFNVTSWGGNILNHGSQYHMYVTEMAGNGCGLHVWGSQSTVVHAIASDVEGPYVKQSTVVKHEAHNPQAIQVNGSFYIFHIGSGSSTTAVKACKKGSESDFAVDHSTATAGSNIHKSADPAGPFTPITATNWTGCNNPSPFLHPNGTLFLVCTWNIRSAASPEGPWSDPITLHPPNTNARHWEDPFLYIDKRGNWHILSHTYSMLPYPSNAISGHAYSINGLDWTFSPTEPYNNTVVRTDGSTDHFSTMERPKLVFDPADPTRPTHLTNGVSPVWNTSARDPCRVCGHCSHCKVQSGLDWTYTLIRPLATSS